jgi:hypothetical protein
MKSAIDKNVKVIPIHIPLITATIGFLQAFRVFRVSNPS